MWRPVHKFRILLFLPSSAYVHFHFIWVDKWKVSNLFCFCTVFLFWYLASSFFSSWCVLLHGWNILFWFISWVFFLQVLILFQYSCSLYGQTIVVISIPYFGFQLLNYYVLNRIISHNVFNRCYLNFWNHLLHIQAQLCISSRRERNECW